MSWEDYEETFALVVRLETLHVIFALLASRNYEAKVWDVVAAFLNALLNTATPLYVSPPQGYEEYAKSGRLFIWFLLRALYGLKQAPRMWYEDITVFMAANGFFPLPSNPCVLQHLDGRMIILWVDDILVIAPTISAVEATRCILEERYQLRDMGDLVDYVGLQIMRDWSLGLLFVNQSKYAEKILHKFHLTNCILASLPTPSTEKLLPYSMTATSKERFLYQAMIGSLMWLTIWTRPDLAERTRCLGQFSGV